jgi:8-oxo-dGTP pyrophosphatase MutT (NUDIX family)
MTCSITDIDRVEGLFEPREWPFARQYAAKIEAHWASLIRANPTLFNGRVLLQHAWLIEAGIYHARYLETDYSAFIAWRDFGWPDKSVRNAFAMAALRASDGAFLLGEMAAHTSNAGQVYFAAGTPDPDDITSDGRVDLLGNLLRELEEETGLDRAEVAIGEGWAAIVEGQRLAFMRPARIDMKAKDARALILSRLSQQERPELRDIRIVRSTADINPARTPAFACAYLARMLAG